MPGPAPRAEFDAFAAGYDGGIGDPLKRLAGKSADTFFEHKVDWLLRNLSPAGRLLDFGCGTGTFLSSLRRSAAPLELFGCDISAGMVEAAHARWDAGALPVLQAVAPGPLPLADAQFDVVTSVCVLHHIDPAARLGTTRELVRVLKPGGRLVVFEHNPLNPATRWLVARAPIDANAQLLRAADCARLLAGCGAEHERTDYILFFPPRIRRLWSLERFLARVPLGGQYVVVGRKPSEG